MGSKVDALNDVFNLPKEVKEEGQSTEIAIVEKMPDQVVESLRKNKEELNEIYRGAKKLLMNLIDDVTEVGRARDIEVLTEFMAETSNLLTKIRNIDIDIIDVDSDKGGGAKGKQVTNFIFQGDTRDLIHLVKDLRKAKSEEKETINVTPIVKAEEK